MITQDNILPLLQNVKDPEVPVINAMSRSSIPAS